MLYSFWHMSIFPRLFAAQASFSHALSVAVSNPPYIPLPADKLGAKGDSLRLNGARSEDLRQGDLMPHPAIAVAENEGVVFPPPRGPFVSIGGTH
jgi:hypothetical protein